MASKNEKAAKKAGISLKEYKKSKNSKKSKDDDKKSSSSKNDGDFKQAMKDAGAWDSYNNLSPDQQEFIKYNWQTGKSEAKDVAKNLSAALDEATAQADPYWKSFLTVAQDELTRAWSDEQTDYAYDKNLLETRIAQIGEDLVKNKDFYTLEQQSDLAKLKQSYEQQRDTVITDAAANGLTFSTNREKPLKQLSEYNANVVESTNRTYEKKLSDIELEAGRTKEETAAQLAQRLSENTSNLTKIGRSGEAALGSGNLPTLEGYNALGNVTGKMYEDKIKDIEDRKNAIFNEKQQTSLTF